MNACEYCEDAYYLHMSDALDKQRYCSAECEHLDQHAVEWMICQAEMLADLASTNAN